MQNDKMPESRKTSKRMSRSIRLRKYESVYKSCIESLSAREKANSPKKKDSKREPRKKTESKKRETPEKKERKKKVTPEKKKERKKKDEKKSAETPKVKRKDDQKWMRSESKKSKYNGMTGGERMKAIGEEWRKKNKKE